MQQLLDGLAPHRRTMLHIAVLGQQLYQLFLLHNPGTNKGVRGEEPTSPRMSQHGGEYQPSGKNQEYEQPPVLSPLLGRTCPFPNTLEPQSA